LRVFASQISDQQLYQHKQGT